MSFGFGVSDFLAVIQLANKIRKDFAGAPNEFNRAVDIIRSLSIVQDAEIAASERELNPEEEADLKSILEGCQNILSELERTLYKYTELESQQTSIGRRVKRVWKRLSLEPADIRNLRSRVNDNITLLNAFTLGRTRDKTTKLLRYQEDQEEQAILNWLTPVDYAPQQNDFFKQRQAGTGQWLLDSEIFKRWVETKKQTLFCPGIPGAGKTILTSIVVDELCTRFCGDNSSIAVAYIYCNFKRQNEQTLEDILTSILKQLAQGRSLPQSVKSLHDQCKSKQTRPSIDDISTVLRLVAAEYSRVFILIDALDECRADDSCQANLLSKISDLQTKCGVNFFATSRFIPHITEIFERDLILEIRANKEDVQRYLEEHIDELPRFVRRDPDLQQEISSAIVKTIDGMFLLAQLHLTSLKGKRSPTSLRDALKKLPTGSQAYDRAYSDAMNRIEGQLSDQEILAKEVLSWITCAKRPLTTTELQHALAIKVGQAEFDEGSKTDIEDIVSVCAGLVTVDEEGGIIRLVHYTTQEYFERTQKKWFSTVEFDISSICVTYLSFTVFGSGFCHTDSSFEERLRLNPLYDYAARYWGDHARQASSLNERIIDFLKCESKVEAATQGMLARKRFPSHSDYSQHFPRRMTGLHLAAYFGITNLIEILLRSVDVESKDTSGRTPLSWAAQRGHATVVKQLLEAKANVEAKSGAGTPLSYAAGRGHEAVVKQLLEARAEVDPKDAWDQTPLLLAAAGGHEAVVKMLLEANADVDSKDVHDRTPLLWAAERGHAAVVKQLLEAKANVEAKDGGRTSLSYAAQRGHEAVVKQLLEAGADVEANDVHRQTPLLFAAARGHDAVVKQLLDANANVEAKDIHSQTPLLFAAARGHDAVVKQLLEAKANVETKDKKGQTALSHAAAGGHEVAIRLLLSTSTTISSQSSPPAHRPSHHPTTFI